MRFCHAFPNSLNVHPTCIKRDAGLVVKALKLLCERGVRLLTLQAGHHVGHHVPMVVGGGELDLVPEAGGTFLKVLRLGRETQRALRSRRARETARARKAAGLAVGHPPMGKRVVRRQGVACLEWDKTELRHIAEIARRVPLEGA